MPTNDVTALTSTRSMCDDPAGVASWLVARGESFDGEVTITRVGFGQSNLTTIARDEAGDE